MNPDSDDPHTHASTTTHLKKAIAEIDYFALNNISSFNKNPLITFKRPSAALRFFKSFFSLFRQKKKREDVQRQLLRSVDIIKNHHLLLDRWQKGNEEQKRLSKKAFDAIERYNAAIGKLPQRKLARFLLRRRDLDGMSQIDLPQTFSVVTGEKSPVDQAAKAAMQNDRLLPATEELDAFRMKAISMILKQSRPCLKEVMNQLRTSPISTTEESGAKVIAMQQHITPFPGEVIEVKGAFARSGRSVPLLERFSLFSQSVQTGFPHPCQHTGFALSDELIPTYPHRPSLLRNLSPLLEKKKELAKQLLPEGTLIAKGKQILQRKQEAFNKNEVLSCHRQFAKKLALALGCTDVGLIDALYDKAENSPSPFQRISQEYERIGQLFIATPFAKLQQAWVEQTCPALYDPLPEKRYAAAKECLHISTSGNEFEQGIYNAASEIILQQFSEKLEYAPPSLSTQAKMMQAMLYQQLSAFIEGFEENDKTLTALIEKDESLIERKTSPFVEELADYYTLRYQQIIQAS